MKRPQKVSQHLLQNQNLQKIFLSLDLQIVDPLQIPDTGSPCKQDAIGLRRKNPS